MKKSTLSTVTSKFKRHNLSFDYDEATNTIEIGKAKKGKRKILKGIVLVIIGLIAIIIVASFDFPFKKIVGYLTIVPFAFGLREVWDHLLLSKMNQNQNWIKPNEIVIKNKKQTISIKPKSIQQIDVRIKKIDADSEKGALVFSLEEGEKLSLFTLIGQKGSHLKEDLEYLKKIIVEHIGVDLK